MHKNIAFFTLLFVSFNLPACGPNFFMQDASEENLETSPTSSTPSNPEVKKLLQISKENSLEVCINFLEKLPEDIKNPLICALLKK